MIKETDKYIPKFYNRDKKLRCFTDIHDKYVEEVKQELLFFKYIYDPVRTPYIDDLAAYIEADVFPFDSERTKRFKTENAIKGHKTRSLWKDDVKLKIDSIAGGDSQIINSQQEGASDWIMFGSEKRDPSNYWGTMGVIAADTSEWVFESETDLILVEAADTSNNGTLGTDGTDDFGGDLFGSQVGNEDDANLGLDLIGAGNEAFLPGIIYIDVDNRILTEGDVEQIVITLEDSIPAYYIVYLGYFNNDGQYVVYSNGIIG